MAGQKLLVQDQGLKVAASSKTKIPISTFEHHSGVAAHEVPISTPHIAKTIERTSFPREEVRLSFLGRSSLDPRKVRLVDFQKWVKKFNGLGDTYDHLVSFAKKLFDYYTLVKGFGL